MSHHQRGLLLRFLLIVFGVVLAAESYYFKPHVTLSTPSVNIPHVNTSSDPSYDPSPSWSDSNNDSGGGWSSSDDSGWDSSDSGGWDDSSDSDSWDSSGDDGGDSGSW